MKNVRDIINEFLLNFYVNNDEILQKHFAPEKGNIIFLLTVILFYVIEVQTEQSLPVISIQQVSFYMHGCDMCNLQPDYDTEPFKHPRGSLLPPLPRLYFIQKVATFMTSKIHWFHLILNFIKMALYSIYSNVFGFFHLGM